MITRYFLAPLMVFAMAAPAIGAPHVVARLGTSPLVGQIDSTQTLQTDVARNQRLFASAGAKLGLSPEEYRQVRERIAMSRLTYVTIPRHLDAMTWASNGRVYAVHDVIIPAGTKGWEIDVPENGQLVAVFIPNKCGNLSVIRKPLPAVASLPTRVEAYRATPAPAPAPQTAPAPAATEAPAPTPTPAPYSTLASSTAPAAPAAASAHHFPWLLLAIPVIALIGGSHSGGGSTIPLIGGPPPSGNPTPQPTICPTPPPHR